ncbi:MAG: prenyltransferase/squalene oxidase repeat-containing protein [Candidatus Nanopelagicales bacterium]
MITSRTTSSRSAGRRRALTALAAAVTAATTLAAGLPAASATPASPTTVPAMAPTVRPAATASSGLYGVQDPTYDGVYRQATAILGLRAVGSRVPASAVSWLLGQQCPDGGFQAYRAGGGAFCSPTDVSAFTGEDTNSTATAAMALHRVGRRAEAARAIGWLRRAQNTDGGWGYVTGAPSDANSTGLVMAALRTVGINPRTVRSAQRRTGVTLVSSLQLRCPAKTADRGALSYQKPLQANGFATTQGLLGSVTGLPVARRTPSATSPTMRCSNGRQTRPLTMTAAASGFLARALGRDGRLPNAFGPGDDWNATATAVLALVGAGWGRSAVRTATTALQRNVNAYVVDDSGRDRPAALGTLLLVARATGVNPRRFGGTDLVARLRATERP